MVVFLTLAIVLSAMAQAQEPSITCNTTAVPPIVKAEGIDELVADIVLTCIPTPSAGNTGPQTQYLLTNVSVLLNVNVTNNIGFGSDEALTDAILVINENRCVGAGVDPLFANPCIRIDERFQVPQFGALAGVNRIAWNEVDLAP